MIHRSIALLLWPFSLVYRFVIWLRNLAYDRQIFSVYRPNLPVFAIGNLSVGGTGKTPMAEYLLGYLVQNGLRPAYLSRGYGRKTRGYLRVDPSEHTSTQVGDEALQVARKFPGLPVVVCENRAVGVQKLLETDRPDCLLLDDAFQHRRIARDLDIVMLDATRPPWNDRLLPAGLLREPESSLKRAHLAVVNKLTQRTHIPRWQHKLKLPSAFGRLEPLRLRSFSSDETLPLDCLDQRMVYAFSGLGNNEVFFNELRRLGAQLYRCYGFRDHHVFSQAEIQRIVRSFRRLAKVKYLRQPPLLIATEKDYIRLRSMPWFDVQFGQFPFYYLEVALQFWEGEAELQAQLAQHLPQLAQGTPVHAQQRSTQL
ncbi:MAG: tetraacyldisaccharide 4'-kinase [Bacteroidia bacterium]|nr:tetraacyldisaccharide 4'-kinase [Bacteroidia bacterium]